MAAWKCAQCTLVNREIDQACRRCGSAPGVETFAANGGTAGAGSYATSPISEPARVPTYGLPGTNQPAQQMPGVWGGPEAAPQTARFQTNGLPSAGVWRDGSLLVMQKGATLPNRCLKCNAPGNGQWVTRTVRMADSQLAFLRFIPYIRLIFFLWRAASQSVEVSFGLCHQHHSKVNTLITAGTLIWMAGLVLLVYGIYAGSLIWILGLFISVIGTGLRTTPIVKAARMDDYYVWITGADPGYLSSLPPVHG
jgi:hypothetical protein